MDENYLEALRRIEEAAKTGATELDLSRLSLTALPSELWELIQLNGLYLSKNNLNILSPEIKRLTNLTSLNLNDNDLKELPPEIGHLANLRFLFLSNNHLITLPSEISRLNLLTFLELNDNPLSFVPDDIVKLTNLTALFFGINFMIDAPPEIIHQGKGAILRYFCNLVLDGVPQWVSKIVVVGEGGVGKTSLLKRLQGEKYNPKEDSTHGIAIRSVKLQHPHNNVVMTLNAWDFGGQEIYHATHQFFLTNRSLFLLVWNARLGFEQGRLYYWLDTIKALAPESPVMLVATHQDERSADLPLAEIKLKYPQIVDQIEISSMNGTGIEELRAAIQLEAANLPLMGEVWPKSWLEAANAIRTFPEKHVTQQELWELMEKNGVLEDSRNVLAIWLHELGDVLYFPDDEELRDTVIIKPQWVSQYISKVLTSEDVIHRVGIFSRKHMDELWHDINPIMREHFLRLMEKFDLSYRIPEDKHDRSLVVERLSYDEVSYYDHWEAIRAHHPGKEISMKFRLDSTMPAGIPTWFIARSHRFTTHTHWRYGGLFVDGDGQHLALVRAYPHERYIDLTVRGPYPYNFFALLKDGFEVTLARFPGLEFKRMLSCPGHNGEPCSYEFNFKNLETALEKQINDIQCQVTFEAVSVAELLFGLHFPTTQNLIIQILDEMREDDLIHHAEVMAGMHEMLTYIQREFAALYRREQALDESHCPYIFTLTPYKAKFWKEWMGQEIELQLYCQAPGHWHPPTDDGFYPSQKSSKITGKYFVTLPDDWLQAMTPYLRGLVKLLKFAVPIVGAVTSFGLPNDWLKNQFNLTSALVDQMPDLKSGPTFKLVNNLGETISHDGAEGATLRALRKLLDEVDPIQHWGGLKKVLTPEGHYLWLCPHHAAEYH
jgi:internalin A